MTLTEQVYAQALLLAQLPGQQHGLGVNLFRQGHTRRPQAAPSQILAKPAMVEMAARSI